MRPSTWSDWLTSTMASIASQRRGASRFEAELDRPSDRLGIGAEQAVPQRHVAEVARMNVALVMEHVRFRAAG